MTSTVVKYLGPTQHTRILTEADQRTIGAKEDSIKGPIQWDEAHGHKVVIEDIDKTLALYLENSKNFEVQGVVEESEVPAEDAAPQTQFDLPEAEAETEEPPVPSEGDASGSTAAAATVGTPSARSTKTSSR